MSSWDEIRGDFSAHGTPPASGGGSTGSSGSSGDVTYPEVLLAQTVVDLDAELVGGSPVSREAGWGDVTFYTSPQIRISVLDKVEGNPYVYMVGYNDVDYDGTGAMLTFDAIGTVPVGTRLLITAYGMTTPS